MKNYFKSKNIYDIQMKSIRVGLYIVFYTFFSLRRDFCSLLRKIYIVNIYEKSKVIFIFRNIHHQIFSKNSKIIVVCLPKIQNHWTGNNYGIQTFFRSVRLLSPSNNKNNKAKFDKTLKRHYLVNESSDFNGTKKFGANTKNYARKHNKRLQTIMCQTVEISPMNHPISMGPRNSESA
jgi:hypothetical protein